MKIVSLEKLWYQFSKPWILNSSFVDFVYIDSIKVSKWFLLIFLKNFFGTWILILDPDVLGLWVSNSQKTDWPLSLTRKRNYAGK